MLLKETSKAGSACTANRRHDVLSQHMDLISEYLLTSSDEEGETSCEENAAGPAAPISPPKVRSVYLLTYSQADLSTVPTREDFAHMVLEAFSKREQTANPKFCSGSAAKKNTSVKGFTITWQ